MGKIIPRTHVPARPVAEHIDALRATTDAHVNDATIAAAACATRPYVTTGSNIFLIRTRVTEHVHRDLAEAVLGVTAESAATHAMRLDARTYRAKLDEMRSWGWSVEEIRRWTGTVTKASGQWVTRDVAERIDTAYDRLKARPAPTCPRGLASADEYRTLLHNLMGMGYSQPWLSRQGCRYMVRSHQKWVGQEALATIQALADTYGNVPATVRETGQQQRTINVLRNMGRRHGWVTEPASVAGSQHDADYRARFEILRLTVFSVLSAADIAERVNVDKKTVHRTRSDVGLRIQSLGAYSEIRAGQDELLRLVRRAVLDVDVTLDWSEAWRRLLASVRQIRSAERHATAGQAHTA